MSRPGLDTQYEMNGDPNDTRDALEGPSAKRLWVSRVVAFILVAVAAYCVVRAVGRFVNARVGQLQHGYLQRRPAAVAALAQALAEGGWFAESHEDEHQRARDQLKGMLLQCCEVDVSLLAPAWRPGHSGSARHSRGTSPARRSRPSASRGR